MSGTPRKNGPCAVPRATDLAHDTVKHGTVGTAARRSTTESRAGTARSCRVPCQHGTVANYSTNRVNYEFFLERLHLHMYLIWTKEKKILYN